MIDPLRGEFSAVLGGRPHAFETTLGTIARIETACDGRSIMDIIREVVTTRRATDHLPLLKAALQTAGLAAEEALATAERATLAEAEAFVLALMEALGFRAMQGGEAEPQNPLAGSSAGVAGGASPSGR